MKTVRTGTLEIAYLEWGPAGGPVAILLHGFPYDVHAYEEVAPALAARGLRVVAPYLRGYGATRFLEEGTPRSGQQAALGCDLRDLMDALGIEAATLAGYDWGGRAACIVSALWPERVRGLVSCGGYNIQDIAGSVRPAAAEVEHRYWYQYYLHTARGAAGLAADRRGFARLLWRLWSPSWGFSEDAFLRTAVAFDNPDFVAVVVQSYRHRFGYAAGDPALEGVEVALGLRPVIGVPSIVLEGGDDGVAPPELGEGCVGFSGLVRREVILGVGHNVPQEAPSEFVRAVLGVLGG